jgi:flagellar hook-associated protein 2
VSSIGAVSSSALTTPTTSSASAAGSASTTSSSNGSLLSFSGLASGIDSASIITALTKFNQQQIDQLDNQKTAIATKQSAFATLQSDLSALQTATNALTAPVNGAFTSFTATPSDPTALSAIAGTAAVPGNYTLTVGSLAQSEQVASQGFADPNATLQQGTFSVQVGSAPATTVTIDGNNNTLQGLADAINTAGGDVSASVINDGSATPYRLLLTSDKTGAANAISVTNNLTSGPGATIDATNTVIQAATDAKVTLGSGSNALTVTSPTDQINSLIPGVSLNLLSADPTKQLTLTVAHDTTAAVTGVQNFVTAYNAVHDYVAKQTAYDPTGANTGVLLGNSDAPALNNALSDALSNTVGGLNASANQLSAAGLAFTSSGDLTFTSDTLTSALNGQTPGVSPTDIKNLFGVSGTSDNTGVKFVAGNSNTQPSAGTPYQVQITAPATRATVVASGPPANSITISPPNNTLSVQVNGLLAYGFTLPTGTYTADSVLGVLQTAINSVPALQGNSVSVGLNSTGQIQITSQQYGSGSQVAVTGGSAASLLGFKGTESATGTNVAGNFVVNGKTEAATGTGQYLVGNSGNANTAGLDVQSTLTAPGSANVTVSQGLASNLNTVLNSYLDPTNGKLVNINNSLNQQTTSINTTISQQNTILSQKTTQLQAEFAQMETSINSLKSVQTQLSSLGILSYSTTSTSK